MFALHTSAGDREKKIVEFRFRFDFVEAQVESKSAQPKCVQKTVACTVEVAIKRRTYLLDAETAAECKMQDVVREMR